MSWETKQIPLRLMEVPEVRAALDTALLEETQKRHNFILGRLISIETWRAEPGEIVLSKNEYEWIDDEPPALIPR